jgi:hypothetical protein
LRAGVVEFDAVALQIINAICGTTSVIANEPDQRDRREYAEKEAFTRALAHLSADEPVIFLEVTVTDPSDFESDLCIRGEYRFGYRVLRVSSSNVANTIAAVLLAIRDRTRTIPHVYFNWRRATRSGTCCDSSSSATVKSLR